MYNRAFEEMRRAALARLKDRDISRIAACSGAGLKAGALQLRSFGKDIEILHPGWEIHPELEAWHALTLLHYLDLADGSALSGGWIPMAAMKDGMVRGGGFDHRFEQAVCRMLEGRDAQEVENACARIGGSVLEGNADFCAVFSFAPRFPLLLKIWYADEDFPPSGRLFVDAAADRFLSIEDAVTVGEIFISLLEEQLNRK